MKSQRQAKILEIIANRNVETQEQLLAALQKEGFRGTQATISRDIKELRIVKELTSLGTYRYTTSAGEMSGSSLESASSVLTMRRILSSFVHCQDWHQLPVLPLML